MRHFLPFDSDSAVPESGRELWGTEWQRFWIVRNGALNADAEPAD